MKSDETTSSVVYPKIPFMLPSDASCIFLQISSYLASLFNLTVRSTTETSVVGTLNDMPVNFPFNSLITLPTALAAPVDDGITLAPDALPALQSFPPFDGPSTVS